MCERRRRLGGSKRFHDRITKSLRQDDDTLDMLEYVKKSGLLVKKSFPRKNKLTKDKLSRSEEYDVNNAGRVSRNNSPDGGTSVSSSMHHSSLCDVVGSEVCEECRKNEKQERFVENSLLRSAISLPDIYRPKVKDIIQLRPTSKQRARRRNQRRILSLPSVHQKPVSILKPPNTIAEEAQIQKTENKETGKKETADEGRKSGKLTPTVGPVTKDGEFTKPQSYKRVIYKHKNKPPPPGEH